MPARKPWNHFAFLLASCALGGLLACASAPREPLPEGVDLEDVEGWHHVGDQLQATASAGSAHLPKGAQSARFEGTRLRATVTTGVAAKTSEKKAEVLRPVDITADEMIVKGKLSRAVFEGNVRAVREDYVLTCKKLIVTYDDSQSVERLVAEGKVRVVQGERVVTSTRADFDNRKEVLVLTGEPVLTEGENRVRGEKVTFDLTTDEVRVSRVKATVKMKDVR